MKAGVLPSVLPSVLLSALLSTCLSAISAPHDPSNIGLLCKKSKILIEKNYIDKTTIPDISKKIDAICADIKISDIQTFIQKAILILLQTYAVSLVELFEFVLNDKSKSPAVLFEFVDTVISNK